MLIAQISDPHIRPDGCLYQGVVDSNRMFEQALQHVGDLVPRPDLLLLTGDLVDTGEAEEYAVLRRLLSKCDIPYLVIPGNHDYREQFRAAFSDQHYLPRSGPLHYCIDDFDVRVVALDSCVPQRHHGALDAQGLAWLERTLAADIRKPTLVMLHHPPFVSGIPYLDAYRYLDPAPLEALLQRFTNIERVLCGHVHRTMLRRWAGTVVCSCPSSTTEIALQLLPDAKPLSFVGPRGCLLHLWTEADGMVTHLSHIGEQQGPFPFA